MARRNCDEYDAWRDEYHVPSPKKKDPVEYREVVRVPLREGESNARPLKCMCGQCNECVGW